MSTIFTIIHTNKKNLESSICTMVLTVFKCDVQVTDTGKTENN